MRPISYKCIETSAYHLGVSQREEAHMGGLFHCRRYTIISHQKWWHHAEDALLVGLVAYLAWIMALQHRAKVFTMAKSLPRGLLYLS